MNIVQLRQALVSFENQPQGTFTMPLSQVDSAWTAIRGLLQSALADQALAITSISTFPPIPPTGQQIVYAGQAALFPWPIGGAPQAVLAVTATLYVDAQGNPQLLIQALPTLGGNTPWTLANSLDGLAATNIAQVTFESGAFLLTSTSTTNVSYPGPVNPYINFSGTIALKGPYSGVGALVGAPPARAIAGHIDLSPGPMPVMNLATAFTQPITLSGIQLEIGCALVSLYRSFAEQGNPVPVPVSFVAVSATVLLGADTVLKMQMPLMPNGNMLPMRLVNGPVVLTSLQELNSLDGGADLQQLIPSGVPPITGFVLKGLSMWIDLSTGTPTRGSITFDIALHTGGWNVLPNGILTLDELGADMRVDFTLNGGPRLAGSLYGHITIAGTVPLLAAVSVPRLDLSLNLDQGTTFSVADLMEQFMRRLTGTNFRPPVDLTVVRFDFAMSIRTGEYQLYGDIRPGWSIALGSYNGGSLVTLSLDQIAVLIQYDGSKLSGNLMAGFTVSGVAFYFTAATIGGDDAIWTLAAGMQEGQKISVSNLLLNFLYPQGQTPGGDYGIPSLEISGIQMEMSLDPANTPFRFGFAGQANAIWTFKPFQGAEGAALHITAILEIAGTKALGPNHRVLPGAEWAIAGSVSGLFTLFGLEVAAAYIFNPDNSSLTFSIFYGERGIAATVTQRPAPKSPQTKETILTISFGDLSLGEVLEFFINLAVPGESRTLSSPWDVLYQINFRNLSLIVNLTTNDVEIHYATNLNLGFARLDAIGLLYRNVNGEGSVLIQLYGDFLGQPYGTVDNPLTWDIISDPAPAVPGQGTGLIDVQYIGMGQHVALSTPPQQLRTVEDVIAALKTAMKPVSGNGNPLDDPAAASLRYDGNSKWLFGVQATLLEGTISLAAVFYDPYLYGALIELAGPRAGGLAGLRFELVYRRITADIGEFSIDLRVPDQFRNWEFGEVSITLGLIHLDIFTNGNFRIDAGFPHDQDFSGSFGLQVFPFIGQGGFYFAYLTGATSERVPRATNGEFSPVIEAGIGLAVGLGKEFSKGPLRAGLSIELLGIFEGVFAPFHPYDRAITGDNYYWVQGTAGIVGKLYGVVDFEIIKVSISVIARAFATVILQAHEPTEISLHLQVTAEAGITIVFFTIHFSFDLTIDESFTIGTHTAAPWLPGPSSDLHAANLMMARLAPPSDVVTQPRLRQQRPQHRQRLLTRMRYAQTRFSAFSSLPELHAGSSRQLLLGKEEVMPWPPIAVFGAGTPKTARIQFVPGFTIADPTTLFPPGSGSGNQIQVVLMLLAENTIDPQAVSAAEVKVRATSHLHASDANDVPGFPLMAEAFFRWAAAAGAHAQNADQISRIQLQDLMNDLSDPEFVQATFAYPNVAGFMGLSLFLEVLGYPTGGPDPLQTSGTFVPMIPELTATVTSGGVVVTQNYGTEPPVSQQYIENLAAYFKQLATNAQANTANDPFASGGKSALRLPAAEAPALDPSMAKVIFSNYFALLTRAAVQAVLDLLDAYPYTYPQSSGPSLENLAGSFGSINVPLLLGKGQTHAHVAAATGIHPSHLARLNPGSAQAAGRTVNVAVAVTPLSIAQDNSGAPLAVGSQFNTIALPYQMRAGQTLNNIAAAAPRQITVLPQAPILPAPTGVAVGKTNAAVPGLLRTNASLMIPAFTYTGLANDTAAFVAVMFQIRNQGVGSVENIDWFTQAVATLNPDVDWSTLAGVSAITVPSGFHNTTAAAVQYPIHQADTLPLIAATFAVFYANGGSYTAAPAGTAFPVSQMQHAITSTDTFASLVTLFPGLTMDALVGANTTADILTPLATLWLPPYGAEFAVNDSLAHLASLFDVALVDLVDMVSQVAPVFAAGTPLTIRDVPSRSVNELAADLHNTAQVNQVAAQVSRFLLYGMRMPAPNDTTFTTLTPEQVLEGDFTGSLYGLYDLTGQQFEWLTPSQSSISVAITSSGAPWVILATSTVSEGSAASANHIARNPRLAVRQPFAGMVLAVESATELDLTIDYATFSKYLPSTTLTLNTDTPLAMPLFEERTVHINLQATIHWQAAVQPALPAGSNLDGPGEPGIWPFTQEMQSAAVSESSASYGLFSVSLNAPPGTEGQPLTSYAWATFLPFTIQRVTAAAPPSVNSASALSGQWLEGTYLVLGTDQANIARLYDLWVHLRTNPNTEATTALYLLYPPNATSSNPRGLASDAVTGGVFLLKTNLSTETRPPTDPAQKASDTSTDPDYSAVLAQPADFITLLWEASVVRPGGFYLQYRVGGSGLPDSIFDPSGRAVINLICLLGSQTSEQASGGPLLPVNNCAVVNDNLDAAAVQIYAQQTSANPPVTRVASVPPGNLGFTMLRTPPQLAFPSSPKDQLTGSLYNLVGFTVAAQAPFAASNEGQPVGPTPPPANTNKWFYHTVFDVARLATSSYRVTQHCSALPSPEEDPYAGITATSNAQIDFAAHDSFGNEAIATDPLPATPIPFRYIDRVIGLSEWPGCTMSFTVQPASGGNTVPQLAILLQLQSANYVPGPGFLTKAALFAASTTALRYKQIFYQLGRPQITVSASVTLDNASMATPLELVLARFAGFAAGAYVFSSQIAGLTPVTATPASGQTLASLASNYSVTAADLLTNNQDLLAGNVLTGTSNVPQYDRYKHNESLNSFATRNKITVAALLGTGNNIESPTPGGISLRITDRVIAVQPNQTLAEMAAAVSCTPGDIATANAATAGLLADELTVVVRGISLITNSSTFADLTTEYSGRGVMTTPAEIATLNDGIAGIFNVTSGGQQVTYIVNAITIASRSTISAIVAGQFAGSLQTFITLNSDAPGLVVENTRLQTGSAVESVPVSETLRRWVQDILGLSMGEFAAANPQGILNSSTSLLLPTLLGPAPLAAVPYTVAPGQSLNAIATLFPSATTTALGEANQDIGGIFMPGQQVSVGQMGPVTTSAEDSIASLLLKFPAPVPSLDQLIAAIAPSTTLLQAGALLICPAPQVPQNGLSLAALANIYGIDLQTVARANASLDGFLNATQSVTLNGATILIGAHGTLTSLLARAIEQGVEISFEGMIAAIAQNSILAQDAKFLLPPPGVQAYANLPATPAVNCAITPVSASIIIARPPNQVDPDFAGTLEVASASSFVPPLAAGSPASYMRFATLLESAWPGQVRIGVGGSNAGDGTQGQRLMAVRFAAQGTTGVNAIMQVEVPNTPAYFALPPLSNQLISRTAQVRIYKSGADDPLPPPAEDRIYQGIDVQTWASSAMQAIDLLLSPAYATGAFAVTSSGNVSTEFNHIVSAKGMLANKISQGIAGVLLPAGGVITTAQEALRQTLSVSLVEGFTTDAVLQLPTAVSAQFDQQQQPPPNCADSGGHRLAGKPQSARASLDTTTTLNALASTWHVNVDAIARLLGDTPNLLATGTVLHANGKSWTIGAHDTLRTGVITLDLQTLDAFASAFGAQSPLFRDEVSVTVDGYSTSTVFGSTLASMADLLSVGVGILAISNQDVTSLLTGSIWVNGVKHDVTSATSSLAGMAQAVNLPIEDLAFKIAEQSALAVGVPLFAVDWVPDYTLSTGKIKLDEASSELNLLLNLKQRADRRRLLLNLQFQLTGLEYDVAPAPFTAGYEKSQWLQFINPLDGAPPTAATIDTNVGQLDIPVPLRAYPAPVRLVNQYAQASLPGAELTPIQRAKSWRYLAIFETGDAAQDVVYLKIGTNFRVASSLEQNQLVIDPFNALAEFNMNYAAIQSDLDNLLLPPDVLAANQQKLKAAQSAVKAMSVIVGDLAANWGPVQPSGAADRVDSLLPLQSYEFRMETRVRSGADAIEFLDALVLVRTQATTSWGPRGEIPHLGYIDAQGNLQPLKQPAIPPGPVPTVLLYEFEQDVLAFTRRNYAIWYDNLDAIVEQNARLSARLTRNELLTPTGTTNPAFVYRTPETHFYDIASPAIMRAESIPIGQGSAAGYAAALTNLFTELLGPNPLTALTQQKFSLRYGFRLVTPADQQPDSPITDADILTLVPVLFRPSFTYAADVPTLTQDAVNSWLVQSPPAPGQAALLSIDLTVFSTLMADRTLPLLEFKRLDYFLSTPGKE